MIETNAQRIGATREAGLVNSRWRKIVLVRRRARSVKREGIVAAINVSSINLVKKNVDRKEALYNIDKKWNRAMSRLCSGWQEESDPSVTIIEKILEAFQACNLKLYAQSWQYLFTYVLGRAKSDYLDGIEDISVAYDSVKEAKKEKAKP